MGLLEFGHVRTIEYITTTAAYVGAAHAARGYDGAEAATQYMKDNGVSSKGKATDKDSVLVAVEVSHHVSVVNYWEARVRYSEPSSRRLKMVFPKGFEATHRYRWYVSRSYSKKGKKWTPDEAGVTAHE